MSRLRILRALARLGSVVVGVVALLLAQHARATGITIAYQAPEGCGTQGDFEAGVSRIVGKPIGELSSAWASADVQIAPKAESFTLRVRVVSKNGNPRERDLTVTSCHEALEAAELIVATNLSAPAPEVEAEPAAEPASDQATGTQPVSDQPANAPLAPKHPRLTIEDRPTKPGTAPSAGRSSAPFALLLGARFGLDPLLSPSPAAVGWGMLGVASDRLRVELSAGASSHVSSPVAGGGAVVSSWLGVSLSGCYAAVPDGALRLWLCAGAEAGRFRATGENGANLQNAHASDSLWSAALAQAELLVPITRRLSLAFAAQGVAALRTVHVTQTNAQTGATITIYSTPSLNARPWVGLEVRF